MKQSFPLSLTTVRKVETWGNSNHVAADLGSGLGSVRLSITTHLAELHLSLYVGLKGLHVMENQRESDETSRDSDGAEHHGSEGYHP